MSNTVILFRIFLAICLGTVIGVEREMKNRPAGMRTHILVCLGACTIALIETSFTAKLAAGGVGEGVTYNFSRLCAQVISGIGFLGAGTILLSDKKVIGLTTAASLWNAACLGLAIGYGYYMIAVAGSLMVVIVLVAVQHVIHVRAAKKVEIRFVHRVETIEYINRYFQDNGVQVIDVDFNVSATGEKNIYTNQYTLHLPSTISYTDIVNALSEHKNIMTIHTTSI